MRWSTWRLPDRALRLKTIYDEDLDFRMGELHFFEELGSG
jgi:hypothetical protein